MADIHLGDGPDGGVSLNVERLVESRLLINANSGAGKSWTLRRVLEQTHKHVQQIVIDPEGEFHTLREKFDYVLAGRGGDCPATPKTAPLLARRLLELGVSAVVDIFDLKKHERLRFVRLFLEAMMGAPRHLWHPCLVVVDEAHKFCPEQGQAESAAAVIDLMSQGRKRGFCGVLATQRLAKLGKDAAAEANNLLIGRTALNLDLKRAADDLGLTAREAREALRTLPAGRFYAFGPAISDTVKVVQVGAVATKHPKSGQGSPPPTPPRERIKKILGQLADLPQEAEVEAKSVAALEQQVRDLRRQLSSAARGAGPDPVDLKAKIAEAEARGVERGRAAAVAAGRRATRELLGNLEAGVRDAIRAAGNAALAEQPSEAAPAPAPRPSVARAVPAPRPAQAAPAGEVGGAEQRLLNSLAWFEAIGVDRVEWSPFAFVAGYSPKSSGFEKKRGELRAKGLIEYPADGCAALTDAGRSIAVRPDIDATNAGLQEAVLSKVAPAAGKLLRPLIEAYPRQLTFDQLAEASGYSPRSSGFEKQRGHLRSLGLVDYPQAGSARAADLLFPEPAGVAARGGG